MMKLEQETLNYFLTCLAVSFLEFVRGTNIEPFQHSLSF